MLGFDRALESVAQRLHPRNLSEVGRQRLYVAASDVARVPVHASQQIAQTPLECIVAVRAAKPARRAEIRQCAGAERTMHGFAFDAGHLLMDRLQKIVDLWL